MLRRCHFMLLPLFTFSFVLWVSVSPLVLELSVTGLCFFWQIEMNCVNEEPWVALGTPLRGVSVTLSPGAGNNRRNQLLRESVWHSGGAVYKQAGRSAQAGRWPTSPLLKVYRSSALQRCTDTFQPPQSLRLYSLNQVFSAHLLFHRDILCTKTQINCHENKWISVF